MRQLCSESSVICTSGHLFYSKAAPSLPLPAKLIRSTGRLQLERMVSPYNSGQSLMSAGYHYNFSNRAAERRKEPEEMCQLNLASRAALLFIQSIET